jgi:hypothetical protein
MIIKCNYFYLRFSFEINEIRIHEDEGYAQQVLIKTGGNVIIIVFSPPMNAYQFSFGLTDLPLHFSFS